MLNNFGPEYQMGILKETTMSEEERGRLAIEACEWLKFMLNASDGGDTWCSLRDRDGASDWFDKVETVVNNGRRPASGPGPGPTDVTQAKHTPWKRADRNDGIVLDIEVGEHGETPWVFSFSAGGAGVDPAHIDLAIRAVNSHAALLAACEALLENPSFGRGGWEVDVEAAEAAIKLAKGESE